MKNEFFAAKSVKLQTLHYKVKETYQLCHINGTLYAIGITWVDSAKQK